MKWEPVRLGEQSLQKCFMAIFLKIRSAKYVFSIYIYCKLGPLNVVTFI